MHSKVRALQTDRQTDRRTDGQTYRMYYDDALVGGNSNDTASHHIANDGCNV